MQRAPRSPHSPRLRSSEIRSHSVRSPKDMRHGTGHFAIASHGHTDSRLSVQRPEPPQCLQPPVSFPQTAYLLSAGTTPMDPRMHMCTQTKCRSAPLRNVLRVCAARPVTSGSQFRHACRLSAHDASRRDAAQCAARCAAWARARGAAAGVPTC